MAKKGRELYLGVDLGGTKILAMVVAGEGEVLARFKKRTRQDGTPLADQISAAIDGSLNEAGLEVGDILGVGLGVPGVVDSQTGFMVTVPNLEVDDLRLVKKLRKRYDVSVAIANDVNLGTLAECWLGAGRGASTVVGVFVGTGIGGGVVIDGRLRTGPEDLSGEIGHLVLMADGPRCGCGNLGCWEAIASRTAIERDLRQALAEGRQSRILEFATDDRIKSGALARALEVGDELVTEVMQQAGHYLGQGVLTIRHLLDPELVIFGGGVIEACADFLLPIIEAEVRADNLKGSRDTLRLAVSELGDDAVALGAAAFARAEISGLGLEEFGAEQTTEAAEEDVRDYPHIDEIHFGGVVVEGEELSHDIYIRGNGKVRKRKKRRVRDRYGTSHVLDDRELAKVCKGNPETLIIGRGFHEMVRLTDDARAYLETLGIQWQELPSPEAVTAYNETEGPKALFLHVTC